jgi:hypothetical protein
MIGRSPAVQELRPVGPHEVPVLLQAAPVRAALVSPAPLMVVDAEEGTLEPGDQLRPSELLDLAVQPGQRFGGTPDFAASQTAKCLRSGQLELPAFLARLVEVQAPAVLWAVPEAQLASAVTGLLAVAMDLVDLSWCRIAVDRVVVHQRLVAAIGHRRHARGARGRSAKGEQSRQQRQDGSQTTRQNGHPPFSVRASSKSSSPLAQLSGCELVKPFTLRANEKAQCVNPS